MVFRSGAGGEDGGLRARGVDGVLWERRGGAGLDPPLWSLHVTPNDTDPCVCSTDKGAGKRQ